MRPAEQDMCSYQIMLALHLHLHRPLPLCSCGGGRIGRSGGPSSGCIIEEIVFHHLQQHAWVAEGGNPQGLSAGTDQVRSVT